MVMTTTALCEHTCNVCEIIANKLKTVGSNFNAFFLSVGYARAAAELTRMGYHEEARRLMTGLKK